MTTQKPKPKPDGSLPSKGPSIDSFPADKAGGATVIDFLVKVEVVKSVLRTYVPYVHPPITPHPLFPIYRHYSGSFSGESLSY